LYSSVVQDDTRSKQKSSHAITFTRYISIMKNSNKNAQIKRQNDETALISAGNHAVPAAACVSGTTGAAPAIVACDPVTQEVQKFTELWKSGDRSETIRRFILKQTIYALRINARLTRTDLAEIADMPKYKITAIERGELPMKELSAKDLGSLAGALALDMRTRMLLLYFVQGGIHQPETDSKKEEDSLMGLVGP
jgi:transcriptional regulator with XRE-family HTH domain